MLLLLTQMRKLRIWPLRFTRFFLGLIRNKRRPLQPPIAEELLDWTEPEKLALQQMMTYSFIGSANKIKQELQSFLDKTGVDEMMVAAHIYDLDAKMKSYGIIAPMFRSAEPSIASSNFKE